MLRGGGPHGSREVAGSGVAGLTSAGRASRILAGTVAAARPTAATESHIQKPYQ